MDNYSHRKHVYRFPVSDDRLLTLFEPGTAWNHKPCGYMPLNPQDADDVLRRLTELGLNVVWVGSTQNKDVTGMALTLWDRFGCDAIAFRESDSANRLMYVSLPALSSAGALIIDNRM